MGLVLAGLVWLVAIVERVTRIETRRGGRYIEGHEHNRPPAHRRRPAQADARRSRRQSRKGALRPGRGRRAGRRPRALFRAVPVRIPAGGPCPEAAPSRTPAGRLAKPCPRHGRWRTGRPGRIAMGRGRQGAQRRGTARWRARRRGRFKVDLPNYGVFDEKRVFQPGPMPGPIAFRGVRLGVPICEDIWGEAVVDAWSRLAPRSCSCPTAHPIIATSRTSA